MKINFDDLIKPLASIGIAIILICLFIFTFGQLNSHEPLLLRLIVTSALTIFEAAIIALFVGAVYYPFM